MFEQIQIFIAKLCFFPHIYYTLCSTTIFWQIMQNLNSKEQNGNKNSKSIFPKVMPNQCQKLGVAYTWNWKPKLKLNLLYLRTIPNVYWE